MKRNIRHDNNNQEQSNENHTNRKKRTCSLYDMVKFNYKSAINAYGLCSLQFDSRRRKKNIFVYLGFLFKLAEKLR